MVAGSLPASAISQMAEQRPSSIAVESLLPNGMKLVLQEDHSYPVVSCFIWYRVGSRNETAGLTGISHVLEHLLFHNVGPYKNGSLSTTFMRDGAKFNGYTSDDFTAFYEVLHKSKLELALRAESARMRSTNFVDADVKEEVGRVESELTNESKDPFDTLRREVKATAFRAHPYRNPISGWRTDLQNIGVSQVKAFYDRYYQPDNATLVLVGDFSPKTRRL